MGSGATRGDGEGDRVVSEFFFLMIMNFRTLSLFKLTSDICVISLPLTVTRRSPISICSFTAQTSFTLIIVTPPNDGFGLIVNPSLPGGASKKNIVSSSTTGVSTVEGRVFALFSEPDDLFPSPTSSLLRLPAAFVVQISLFTTALVGDVCSFMGASVPLSFLRSSSSSSSSSESSITIISFFALAAAIFLAILSCSVIDSPIHTSSSSAIDFTLVMLASISLCASSHMYELSLDL
mmetsp:Transcript_8811/g.13215  ORF Transcript_8811/g.13215 Transcript_8811/m.13215 type:complete len:236 (+) Transcript_8811:422-1129(+)